MLLSTSPTAGGTASITVNLSAGQTSGTYYIQGVAAAGTATYTATAPGFNGATGTITLAPSGVVLGDGVNFGPGGTVFGGPVIVGMALLDPTTHDFVEMQQLAGGLSTLTINLSVTLNGATNPAQVTIAPGSSSASFSGPSGSSGTITATTPSGFTDSTALTVNVFFF
jgi:hypothetical protein